MTVCFYCLHVSVASMWPPASFRVLFVAALAIVAPGAFLSVCAAPILRAQITSGDASTGCSISSANVTYSVNKNQPGYFTPAEVSAHLNWVTFRNMAPYARDGTTTLSCIDSRNDHPVIGTPGGDLAEFAMGLYIYNSLTNAVGNYSSVQTLFQQFLATRISASRPFFYHTDDTHIREVFVEVGIELNRNITILPARPSEAEQEVWLTELVKSYAQGCGHLRLMIDSPANYGLPSSQILQWLIRAFYQELWAADTDAKRAKLAFVVVLGPQQGKAIAIVSNKAGACPGYSPYIPPSISGSSVFVYTPSAASAFRSNALMLFFDAQGAAGWNAAQFQSGIATLFNTQIAATLANLASANKASLISIDVMTSTSLPNSPVTSASVAACASVWLYVTLSALLAWF